MRSSIRIEIGVIRHAESSETVSFEIHPRTSGLNRKLQVLRDLNIDEVIERAE